MHYILSLRHTQYRDKYITLWRPDNAGYCYSREHSGIYESVKPGYHDTEGDLPLPKEEADKLFEKVIYDGLEKHMILNNRKNLEILGLHWLKGELIRKVVAI